MDVNYWATLPDIELAPKLSDFVRKNSVESHPMRPLWSRAYGAYYANAFNGDADSSLNFLGRQGEIIQASINEFRKVLRQGVSIITRNKLNFEPSTETADPDALEQAANAKHLCAWWITEDKIDRIADRLGEAARLFGTGFVGRMWRPDLGEEELADPEMGTIYRKGKMEFFTVQPWDVFFDWRKSSWEELECLTFRVRRNRYSLASMHADDQEIVDAVLGAPSAHTEMQEYDSIGTATHRDYGDIGEETIFVYYFVHRPCPALPKGRLMTFLGNGKRITDAFENPYEDLMLYACIPESFQSTEILYGFPSALDMLPPQESLDTVFSALTTNLSNLGVQAVQAPDASNVDVRQIGGLSFFSVKSLSPGGNSEIKPLQLTQNPGDGYKFVDYCRNYVTELGDLNGALRGTPPSGVDSGIALATLSANALEALQPVAKELVMTLESLMSGALVSFAKFAGDKEFVVPLKNAEGKVETRTITGAKVAAAKRVQMKISNPLLLSLAGKISLTKELLTAGTIKSSSEYVQLLETGSLPAVLEEPMDEASLIARENEGLKRGDMQVAVKTDLHNEHIISHKCVFKDPEMRRKANSYDPAMGEANPPDVLQAYLVFKAARDHIDEHLSLIDSTDPRLTAIVQTGKLPAPAPMGGQ